MYASRRSALKRGLVALGAVFGAKAAGPLLLDAPAAHAAGAGTAGRQTLTIYGRHWQRFSPVRRPGELPDRGDRFLASGDLHLVPEGPREGEFHAALFSLGAPGQVGPAGFGAMELHTFSLADGSIIGTGTTSPDPDRPDDFAIIGGTGRFAGIRGTYSARQGHREAGGDGTAELTFTFITEEI
jgi:hypothetical protein